MTAGAPRERYPQRAVVGGLSSLGTITSSPKSAFWFTEADRGQVTKVPFLIV